MSSPVLQGSDLVDKVQTLNLREICVFLFIKLTQSDLAALPNSHTPAPLERGLFSNGTIDASILDKSQKKLYAGGIEDKTN
jgi:hypothetical protein